jgi:hypothetical protein
MKTTNMNKILPAIVCTTAIFTTLATSQELIIAKNNSSTTKKPTKENIVKDPAITTITHDILQPIRLQAERTHTFSRRSYTPPSTYNLVEVTSSKQQGVRFFNIMITPPKTNTLSLNVSNQAQTKDTTKAAENTPKPTVHLHIKYLTETHQVLIKQNEEWVTKSDHNYLKLLPKITNKK